MKLKLNPIIEKLKETDSFENEEIKYFELERKDMIQMRGKRGEKRAHIDKKDKRGKKREETNDR